MEKYFKPIDAGEYTRKGIVEGIFIPEEVRKSARIKARRGTEGEVIETILPSGLKEVSGTVKIDPKTGKPGWVATNPKGEEYIIEDSDFEVLYMEDPEHPGEYKKKVPVLAVQIDENVVFTNSWGEEMKVEAGGHLVFHDGGRGLLGKGTYGVAAEAWDTYETTGLSRKEALKKAIKAYGITREEMETAIRARQQKYGTFKPAFKLQDLDD
jgi:hypothetical protein